MTTFRTAGEPPPTGNKRLDEFLKAFRFFGQIRSWSPVFSGPTLSPVNTTGRYVRLGPMVFFYVRADFTVTAGTSFVINSTLPFPQSTEISSGLDICGLFWNYDFVNGRMGPSYTSAVPSQMKISAGPIGTEQFLAGSSYLLSGFGLYWID